MSSPQQSYSERKLTLPSDWVSVEIPAFKVKLTDRTTVRVEKPYSFEIAVGYGTDESGHIITNVTQETAVEYLRANGLRLPFLFEDEAVRWKYGRNETSESGHPLFDWNFGRKGKPWEWGYIAEKTKSHGALKPVSGVNGQPLIVRELYWITPDSEEMLVGPVEMAGPGMVPYIPKQEYEKLIGTEGLLVLEKLGVVIPDSGNEILWPIDKLGFPKHTLQHDERDVEGNIIPHSHHFYPSSQEQGEAVGVRDAGWHHRGARGCFGVLLGFGAGSSIPRRSFPLVRGGGVVEIIPENPVRRIQLSKTEKM